MNQFKIQDQFSITKFLHFLNDTNKSSFRFTIKDEKYIDVMFEERENYSQQIRLLIPLLFYKLPILLERQKQIHNKYASYFKLQIDVDCVTKSNEINYPIIGIQDNLINNPLFCDQQVFFENVEYKLQQNDNQLEIMIDVEEFGIILLFSRLLKLILKYHENINIKDVKFDIIIYPSNNNFAIIKQNTDLYFYDEQHRELFLKQNSKKIDFNLFRANNEIQFAYNKNIESCYSDYDQQEQCQSFKNNETQYTHKMQLNYQLFKIYQIEELIERGFQIKNRSNQKFREQLKLKKKFQNQIIVIPNQINFCFSNHCQLENLFGHFVQIQNDSIIKCACGQQFTVDNFDLLLIDPLLIDLIKKIQEILLLNNRLDSCLFGYPIHLKVLKENKSKIIKAFADDQLLFEVLRDRYFEIFKNEDQELRKELLENNDYSTEENWEDKSLVQQNIQDNNKTNG